MVPALPRPRRPAGAGVRRARRCGPRSAPAEHPGDPRPRRLALGGRYRDNQGYYFRASRRAELERRLPGIGAASDTFVSDAITDERFAYYLGVNNVLGLIGAFGSARLADERVLLAAFRRFLGKAAGLGPLPAQLLDSPTLRCKANLLTRLGGLDELVGPVDTQSVYVTIANPLHD
ncbi:hypothetical protein GCM10020254_25640 [Streptomyces goshikiensis]